MLADNAYPVYIIESQNEFDALCAEWSELSHLSFDTEFIRTNTFYPKLGLLQIADSSACYLIDPLCISNWSGFTSLLNTAALQFTVHSCSEDLNLLSTTINSVPANLFDTQIAAAFTGLGFSLSYQGLVKLLLDTDIAKDETRSDWLKRPLTDRQLTYAANDVCYLEMLRGKLLERLESMNRTAWFNEECAFQLTLADDFENRDSWMNAYAGVSNAWKLADNNLVKLQELCLWREEKARERNKPRNWIAKDSDLFSLAVEDAVSEFEYITFSDRRFYSRYGDEIVDMLDSLVFDSAAVDRSNLNYPLTPALRKKLKSCQKVVAEIAEKMSIAPELLARKRLLQDLVRGYENSGELLWEAELSGWRREILEQDISGLFSQ
jgi:ribonuclease D